MHYELPRRKLLTPACQIGLLSSGPHTCFCSAKMHYLKCCMFWEKNLLSRDARRKTRDAARRMAHLQCPSIYTPAKGSVEDVERFIMQWSHTVCSRRAYSAARSQ